MDRNTFLNDFWRYYLILENKFLDITDCVELVEGNYSTYSYEFVNLIQLVGSEVDVLMKQICELNPSDRKDISDYEPILKGKFPSLVSQEVEIKYKIIIIKPFADWDPGRPSQSLSWWHSYNAVKHSRVANFNNANLQNVLYALAALFMLEIYYLKEIASQSQDKVDIPNKDSDLFTLKGWTYKYLSIKGTVMEVTDIVPS